MKGYIQYYDGEYWNKLIAVEDLKGEDGDDADVWTIGTDGYWYKNGVKTNNKATGSIGAKGNGIKSITPSTDSAKTNETQTTYIITFDDNSTYEFVVKNGTNGTDGTDGNNADVWTIGTDGYWYKNGVKTNNKAIGSIGAKGNGIKSITTSDDPDKTNSTQTTYIITFDDNSTYEFIIKNGTDGTDGQDASYTNYVITYDYGKASELFESIKVSDTIKSTEWLTTLPEIKTDYENSFLGWFIQETNKKVSNYDFVGGNVTLEARFDIEKLGLSGFYQQGKYTMTWNDLLETYPDAFASKNSQIKGDSSTHSYSCFKALSGEMVIDKSITSIGRGAFYQCDNITKVIIPNTITAIGNYGFAHCDLLTEIKLPDSILTISANAFTSCKKLETIKMSSNLQTIGNNAFMDCESLIGIEIPNSVTTMGWYVFSGCDKISSITIPENLQQIDTGTFADMDGLETINYNAIKLNDLTLEDLNGADIFGGVGYNVDSVTINIGSKVERIPSYLFDLFYTFSNQTYYADYDTKFVVNFKNAIKCQSIGDSAFSHLETVENVILSNHLVTIEDNAFGYWFELTDVYFYGTEDEWNAMTIGSHEGTSNGQFTNATKHYYSATKPIEEGNYWHYDIDGITPIAW